MGKDYGATALKSSALQSRAVERHATTAAEVTIGVLSAVTLCLLMIVLGLLMAMASPAWRREQRP
jgi:hypothetical protein